MTAAEPSSSTRAAQERYDNDGITAMQGAPLLPQALPPPHSVTQEKNGAVFQQQQAPVPFGYGTGIYQPFPLRIPGSEIAYSKRWHVVKLAFQTASLVCSAIIFAIGLALGTYAEQWGDPWEVDIVFAVDASAAGLAILWTVAEFLALYASKERRGIHPGAHVGVQLIIVLVASLGVGIGGVFAVDFTEYYDEDETAIPNLLKGLMRTLFAFSIILWIIHFFLFVRACVETHIVNSTNKARRITYVRVPVPVPMPMDQIPQNLVAGQHSIPPQQNMVYGGYYAPISQSPSTIPSGSQQQPGVPPQGYYASPS